MSINAIQSWEYQEGAGWGTTGGRSHISPDCTCKIASWWEAAIKHREPNAALSGDLDGVGWGSGGGRSKRERIFVSIWLSHFIVQQ